MTVKIPQRLQRCPITTLASLFERKDGQVLKKLPTMDLNFDELEVLSVKFKS